MSNVRSALMRQNKSQLVDEIVSLRQLQDERGQKSGDFQDVEKGNPIPFQNAAVGIAEFDLEGHCLRANDQYSRFLGYEPDELVGLTPKDVTTPEFQDMTESRTEKLMKDGSDTIATEKLYLRKDGTTVWGKIWLSLVRDTEGTPDHLIAFLIDIDDHMMAEEALRQSQAITDEAVKIAQLGHWTWDVLEDKCTYCSEEYARIYGYSAGEYTLRMQNEDFDFVDVHPDDKALFEKTIADAMANQAAWSTDYRIVRQDGGIRHVREIGEPHFNDSGVMTQTIGTIQDITERKSTQEALRISQERFELAMRSTNEIMYDADIANQKATHWSGNLELFGLSEGAESAGAWFDLVHPDDVEFVNQAHTALFKGDVDRMNCEYRVHDIHGAWHWVRQGGLVMRHEDGTAWRLVGSVADFTERKQAEEKLEEIREQFVDATESMDEGHSTRLNRIKP
ncbi:MAG: PAS domain S-box protein [Alphaproteobacteria bacterium]|jgi:PAS domain S-box-containing protein|nr:PAS domain S-box protein [Alphaproteobacteria bacterium]MBT4082664.1 PAS domain S-box protein [Alphaproteobacteria bacterium]MBT4542256.1 PAS domain S-box protein [Alphaproteobacteria bacterium]MBT7745098.1 PAS domain S-box protein [Alphaproteobacteria bacterium]